MLLIQNSKPSNGWVLLRVASLFIEIEHKSMQWSDSMVPQWNPNKKWKKTAKDK